MSPTDVSPAVLSIMAMKSSARRLGVDHGALAESLRDGGIARLVEAARQDVEDGECYCTDGVASSDTCAWCKLNAALAGLPKREGVGNA